MFDIVHIWVYAFSISADYSKSLKDTSQVKCSIWNNIQIPLELPHHFYASKSIATGIAKGYYKLSIVNSSYFTFLLIFIMA